MIDSTNIVKGVLPKEAVQEMRSSLCLLSVLLSRNGEVVMEYPGGCVIGARPIDMHISALECMGADFSEKDGLIYARVPDGFHGADVFFHKVSVGATENVIVAAVMAQGITTIHGAAKEPEVVALCLYLCTCGACIYGIGTDTVVIHGVKRLKGCSYVIPADRIVAGTYMFAVLTAGGSVLLEEAPCSQLCAVTDIIEKMGGVCQPFEEGLFIYDRFNSHRPFSLRIFF
jgi:UDP-N-acetylglucosamine 1-carboxyvinyltransferase